MTLKGLRRSDNWHMTLSRDCHLTITEHLSYNRGLFERHAVPHSLSNAVRCDSSSVKLPTPAEFTPAILTTYKVPFIRPVREN